jgi:hypothetical protein
LAETRCVEAAVPARPGVPLAGVDATVECLVLSDMVTLCMSVVDLKLYKSRLEEDAFQSAPARAKPGPLLPFPLQTLPLLPLFTLVQLHEVFGFRSISYGILNVLLACVHLSYQALVLNYMKSIRGYYCFLGLPCPLLFVFHPSSLRSSIILTW